MQLYFWCSSIRLILSPGKFVFVQELRGLLDTNAALLGFISCVEKHAPRGEKALDETGS